MEQQEDMSLKGKFSIDFFWNLGSLLVLGLSGVLINLAIAHYGTAQDLGVFNQVFAFYIFASQLCVGGVHLAVLHYISGSKAELKELANISWSAVWLAIAASLIIGVPCYYFADFAGKLLDSPLVVQGLQVAVPGLIFFSINKVLLNVLNALRHMRAHAIFQALRFLLILLLVLVVLRYGLSGIYLPAALSGAEFILTLLLVPYVHIKVLPVAIGSLTWISRQLSFGLRGILSGVFTELNTRIDVLILGLFLSDAKVGVYSFAAILAEGFGQIITVMRRNVDPLLGSYLQEGQTEQIQKLAKRINNIFVPVMVVLAAVAAIGYAFVLPYLVDASQYQESVSVLAIFLFGIALSSGYRSFAGIMPQGGKPGLYTIFILLSLLTNLSFNLVLIPILGMNGSAGGAALAYLVEAAMVYLIARKYFAVRI